MIKRVARLLNNTVLLQKPYRFTQKKQGDEPVEVDIQNSQQIKQLAEQNVVAVQGQQLEAGQVVQQQVAEQVFPSFDEFEGINLIDSNWKQIAPLVHTAFSFNKNAPKFLQDINQKLTQMQSMYGFDLKNLDRLKILENKQFDIKAKINAVTNDYSRYLQNNVSQDSRIGYSLMTIKRFKQMIDMQNIPAIIQTYKNNQYNLFLLQSDFIFKIIESVIQTNFKTQYLLNYFEFYRISERQTQRQIKPNKNFDKILHNINNLDQVNKLKFYWSINTIFENGNQLINYHSFSSELSKIGFQDLQEEQTEKLLKLIYNGTLGKDALKKLINYSLNKYSSFNDFLQFWGLFNLLITKLYSLNEVSIVNPSNLNQIFQLYELNTSESRQIIAQVIPEILFQTKNKSLFQIYRVHAKAWIEKKHTIKDQSQKGPYDKFINHKLEFQEPIKILYNGWKSQNANLTYSTIRTTKNIQSGKNYEKKDQILSETKMIEHLIKGDYNFVLNHFLLVFYPGFDKNSFNVLKNIIKNAKQMNFDNQNSRALYILKNISENYKYLCEPVNFRQQFFGSYKKIKWLERADQYKQRYFQRTRYDQGKFSRKEGERLDSQQSSLVNRQKIRSKPKRYTEGKQAKQGGGALFSKKNKNLFSTQNDSYNQYRQVVKQVTQTSVDFSFKFSSQNPDIIQFQKQIEKRSKQMNQNNHKSLLKQNSLPVVGNGTNLLKYLFLKKPEEIIQLDDKLKKKLKVNFISQIGALQKDYSEYIQNIRFNFPLAEEVYISLLEDQKTNYVRRTFKTIVTHMIAFRPSLTQKQVELICQICSKNRIGITLIQIFNLIVENKVIMTKQSIYNFCDTLQKFKKINNDIFLLTKKYCQNVNIIFEIKMMSSYVKNLLIEQQDQKLSELCQIIKNQLKPKPYKLKSNISAEDNLKLQKEYKQFQKQQYKKILFEIIDMVVLNVNNKLPVFISSLFDEYQKAKLTLDAKQIAISLIVYCNNVDKFLQIIRTLKANKQNIILMTYECAIKAARLNPRGLESHSQQIFNVALFTHNYILSEQLIQKSVQIFRILNTPTVFIKFLQYILRFNPPVNYQIKNVMYFIMNNINDDFAKNTISGLLDFIFNSNRQKQREQYRKAQIIQQQKIKLLQDIEKKNFFVEELENLQTGKVIANTQTIQIKTDKKVKKNKQDKQKNDKQVKTSGKQAAQSNSKSVDQTAKPKVAKVQRRRLSLKTQEDFLQEDSEPVLKKTNLKKKLRTKSLNDFEQMFTKREQVEEVVQKGAKPTGKGKPAEKDKPTDKKSEKKK